MNCPHCGRTNLTDRELKIHIKYFHKGIQQGQQQLAAGVCSDCGSTMWFEEGCATCHICGYSKCQ